MDRTKMRLNKGKLPDGQELANCGGGLFWVILVGCRGGPDGGPASWETSQPTKLKIDATWQASKGDLRQGFGTPKYRELPSYTRASTALAVKCGENDPSKCQELW